MHKSYKAMQTANAVLAIVGVLSMWSTAWPSDRPTEATPLAGKAHATKTPATGISTDSASTADLAYGIEPGDILLVSVWKEPELQAEILVRPDGRISFALAGDMQAAGLSIGELQRTLTEKLAKYIPDPVVTLSVKSTAGSRIYVLGKVNRPGEFPLSRPIDVMQALSLAGGATAYAAVNDIRVLRRNGANQLSIKFRYNDVAEGKRLDQNILLKSGDTVVVP